MKREIDFENDFLVINRNRSDGKFFSFRWYEATESLDDFKTRVMEANAKNSEDSLLHEVITDKTTREVCAYRYQARDMESLIENAKEIQESINNASENLRDALDDLNRIRGLG